MNRNKDYDQIVIKFELEHYIGESYKAESTLTISPEFGDTEIGLMGNQFNIFLKQCGYNRERDYLFMEDVTEEERDALSEFLEIYRAGKKRGV